MIKEDERLTPFQESRQVAVEAVELLRAKGIGRIYDCSVELSPNEGVGYDTLWALYWVGQGRKEVKEIQDYRTELKTILGYIDDDDNLTPSGREMYNRLELWYDEDDCD